MGRWAIINVFLGLVILLLGVEIVRTWARALPPVEIAQRSAAPPPEKREKGGGKRGAADKGPGHVEQAPAMLLAAIAEKDLLDISRAKQTEEVARAIEQPPVTGPPPGVVVAGVRIFGRDREAFVTENGVAKRLRTGDQVGGYTVKAIDATGVLLNSPSGDSVTMPLVIEGKGTPAAAPGKPPVPPRPGQPAPQQAAGVPGSPAAGVQTASPAAGIQPKATPTPPAPRMPPGTPGMAGAIPPQPIAPGAQNPQNQNPNQPPLPNDVRQKLERLKQNSGNSRLGRSRGGASN
jgi:hypothetical protein